MYRVCRLSFLRLFYLAFLTVALMGFATTPVVQAQTTSFSYQGRLTDGSGNPLDGSYDLTFELYDTETSGNQVGSSINKTGVSVNNGLFTTTLDFGTEAFKGGAARWLEITVDDGSTTETISPRTKLEAAPTALSMPGVTVDASQQVGVNTTTPGARLDVVNDGSEQTIRAESNLSSSYLSAIRADVNGDDGNAIYATSSSSNNTRPTIFVSSSHDGPGVFSSTSSSDPAIVGDGTGTGEAGRFQDGNVSILDGSGNTEFVFRTNQTNSAGQLSMFASGGTEAVEFLADELGDDGGQMVMRQDDGTATIIADAENTDNGGALVELDNAEGRATLRLRGQETNDTQSGGAVIKMFNGGSANEKTIELDPDYGGGGGNQGRISTDEMKIRGSDVAEYFNVRSAARTAPKPEAGMVVSIDPERPGKLVVSDEVRDRTVAGVISGAGDIRTGIHMGQEGTKATGDQPVAVAGRVYVTANTSNGSIAPGDLLTTSGTPGQAMKVTAHQKAQGAILGKAMTELKAGTGQVLVLISLQ